MANASVLASFVNYSDYDLGIYGGADTRLTPSTTKLITKLWTANSAATTDYTCYSKWYNDTSSWTHGGPEYTWRYYDFSWNEKPKTRSERLREILQSRVGPAIVGTRQPISLSVNEIELRARETLRRVIGEQKYRIFLRNGFVSVRAKSGRVYQIFPNNHYTNVYQNGVMVERLCVILKGDFPPTDSLIMRYLLILNDEADFRSHANVFGPLSTIKHNRQADFRSLPDIYRELRVAG